MTSSAGKGRIKTGLTAPGNTWRTSAVIQTATFVLLDVAIIWIAIVLAYVVRFEGAVPRDFWIILAPVAFIASVLFPVLFLVFGLYGYIWRYVGVPALVRLGWVTLLGVVIFFLVDSVFKAPPLYRPVPLGTLVIFGVFVFLGFFAVRMFGRLVAYVEATQFGPGARNVLIVGAGDAGSLLVRDIENDPAMRIRVVAFVDDDPAKRGKTLGRARVRGTVAEIAEIAGATSAEEIWVAIPTASSDQMRAVLYACGEVRLPVKIVPSIAGGRTDVGIVDLENVELEDFLNREPVVTDLAAVYESISGKRILVTGAGGSIGAEICRQISANQPAWLGLLEVDESRLYETYLECRDVAPSAVHMVLCDIRDRNKLDRSFAEYRPDVVIHAAAYKHVPLMEEEPREALRTNVQGTRNVLANCLATGVAEFVLISTDKAVMPKSVMGATKRISEKLALAAAGRGMSATIVRFGNVLGSRGSVIPIFESALRRGESVHITDPDVTRYFMTIPEAVQLVLQARVLTDGADLFVLDMGEPVRVLDLAQSLIELRGGQAKVEFTGLRPAEKMHEVLVTAEDELLATSCPKVMQMSALPIVDADYFQDVEDTVLATREMDDAGARAALRMLLPEYRPDAVVPADVSAS